MLIWHVVTWKHQHEVKERWNFTSRNLTSTQQKRPPSSAHACCLLKVWRCIIDATDPTKSSTTCSSSLAALAAASSRQMSFRTQPSWSAAATEPQMTLCTSASSASVSWSSTARRPRRPKRPRRRKLRPRPLGNRAHCQTGYLDRLKRKPAVTNVGTSCSTMYVFDQYMKCIQGAP